MASLFLHQSEGDSRCVFVDLLVISALSIRSLFPALADQPPLLLAASVRSGIVAVAYTQVNQTVSFNRLAPPTTHQHTHEPVCLIKPLRR